MIMIEPNIQKNALPQPIKRQEIEMPNIVWTNSQKPRQTKKRHLKKSVAEAIDFTFTIFSAFCIFALAWIILAIS